MVSCDEFYINQIMIGKLMGGVGRACRGRVGTIPTILTSFLYIPDLFNELFRSHLFILLFPNYCKIIIIIITLFCPRLIFCQPKLGRETLFFFFLFFFVSFI